MGHDVIIVGAGIIGASIARALGQRGADVLVVDQGLPAQGASGRSFGWVNASFYHDLHHHRLRAASMRLWDEHLDSLPQDSAIFRGALLWDVPPTEQTKMVAELGAQNYPATAVTADRLRAMVPGMADLPDMAVFLQSEGAVDSAAVTRAWLAQSGARLLTGLNVLGLRQSGGRISGIDTETGPIEAAQVVVAAGTQTQALLASVDVQLPMLRRPGLLMATRPVAHCTEYVLVPPFGEVRQDAQGRLIASTVAGHQGDATELVTGSPEDHGLATLAKLQALFPNVPLELESVSHALRPVPQDGLPAIGPIGPRGLFAATLHSGVTLAPIVGHLLADEMAGQPQDTWLAPYRPTRFEPAD